MPEIHITYYGWIITIKNLEFIPEAKKSIKSDSDELPYYKTYNSRDRFIRIPRVRN